MNKLKKLAVCLILSGWATFLSYATQCGCQLAFSYTDPGVLCPCTGDVKVAYSVNVVCSSDTNIVTSAGPYISECNVPHTEGSAADAVGTAGPYQNSCTDNDPNDGTEHGQTYGPASSQITLHFSDSACGCSDCAAGNGTGNNECIKVDIQLGKSVNRNVAGILQLFANEPGASLSSPSGLKLLGPASDVKEITDNAQTGVLRQIMAPECFVDIVTNSSFKYSAKFYHASDVELNCDTNGYYVILDGRTPFTTWEFENPSGSTNDIDTLRVAQINGSETVAYTFLWTNGNWILGIGAAGETLKKDELQITSNEDTRVETRMIKDASDVVVSKIRSTYRRFAWGREALIERITDPDGVALTQSVSYNEDEGETGKYSQVAIRVNEDGLWQRFDDYDAQGRSTVRISSWQNTVTNALAEEARAVYYSYESVYPYYLTTNIVVTNGTTNEVVVTNIVDNGIAKPLSPRITTEKILGNVVAKTYNVYYETTVGDQVAIEEKCSDSTSAYGASSNLRTIRIYNAKDETSPGSEKLQSVTFPNGRKDTYAYEYGVYIPHADPALCSFTANATGEYVQAICVHGTPDNPDGIANKSTKEVTIANATGRTAMQETYVCIGGTNYTRIDWTVYGLNELGQATDVWKSDGSHSEATWGCCGKEWEKDEHGIEYSYTYDALKRVTQKQKGGIAAGVYPAQSDIYTTYTYDAEGRQLTATVTAGGFSLLSSNTYDLAGRITKSTDAAGLVTEYAYADGGRTVTETLPGGASRITERYKDGQVKSVTGTAQVSQYYAYGVNEDGTKYTTVYSASNNSPVWVKTTTDLLGRTAKVEKPGYLTTEATEYFYNSKGQLVKTTTSGQPDTLYAYDELGNQIQSGLDIDDNGALDLASTDRITESETSYTQISSIWYLESLSRLYATDNSATPTTNSVTRRQLTGFAANTIAETVSIDSLGNQTVSTTVIDSANKLVTKTTDVPNSSSNIVMVSVNGLQMSQISQTGLKTTFAYDALGRRTGATDPRLGNAVTHYDSHGWVDYVDDAAGNRTTFSYDSATGRRISQTDPLTNVTYYSYTDHGQLEKTWGSATYPVSYEYDGYGRMTKLNTYRGGTGWTGSTWPASPGTADTTTWAYHEGSGLLTSKTDATGKSVSYTYSAGGKLSSRTWARVNGTNSLVTTYSYGTAGDLTGIDYSDSTPDVTFTVDRMGRQLTAASSVDSHTFAYNGLLLDTETIVSSAGTNIIDRSYDSYGRSAGFVLGSDYSVAYGYDSFGRFSSVSSSVYSVYSVVNYSYLAGSDLLSGYSDSASGLQVSSTYEQHRNLLTQLKNEVDSTLISQYDYANDGGGRRASVKHSGSAFETGAAFSLYGYNSRSEVQTADRYWGANLNDTSDPVDGQSFAYGYDNIGNRTSSLRENEEMDYTANNLNQYTQRTIPDGIDILGSAETNTTVTVNDLATTRHGKYWYRALTATNCSAADYHQVNVVGVYNPPGSNDPDVVTTETGNVFVAKTPEVFTHDDDGNQLSDGRFSFSWDAENRLIGAETLTNLPSSVPRVKLEFAYDYMSRRVSKTVYSWATNDWSLTTDHSFLYDSWNLISEICNQESQITTNTYVWGVDLSGSLQGAGGIGGLLSAQLGTNSVVYSYDANGNVSEVLTADGSLAAHYEYSPFGETIIATGPNARENQFRFSTKAFDDETELNYYGYRYYSPSLGRWLSRDPLGEAAFQLLYELKAANIAYRTRNVISDEMDYIFTFNNINFTDYLGLACTVRYDCQLASGDNISLCQKQCNYSCTEKSRDDSFGGSFGCNDLTAIMPPLMKKTKGCLNQQGGGILCTLSAGFCDKPKCDATSEDMEIFGLGSLKRDCSKSECIYGCQMTYSAMLAACIAMPPPANSACRAAARLFRTGCIDGCNALCNRP